MELNKVLRDVVFTGNPDNREIKNITHDSRNVKDGSLFIAISGETSDGHDFIDDAIRSGAAAILSNGQKIQLNEVPLIHVKNPRVAMSHISANFYNHPSKEMVITGVTGTNGKTSITHIINNILSTAGKQSGTLGTLGFVTAAGIINTRFTTPESVEIQHMLSIMLNGGINNVVMEISSHALEFNRVDDVDIDVAVFSNLTPEHLDFHGNMESYFNAKLNLFKNLDDSKIAVINIDDPYGLKIPKNTKAEIITYGFDNNADIHPLTAHYSLDGIDALINIKGERIDIQSYLVGEYNLLNLMAGIGAGVALGISIEKIRLGINLLDTVPGRMENIQTSLPGDYFVDYAHTPNAFTQVFKTLKKLTDDERDIITVFGCGGNRDSQKRPVMAAIAENYSDYVFVTSDNPRMENLEKIIEDIVTGFHKSNHAIVYNRKEAIHQAIHRSNQNSIVLLLGKGRDDYEIIGNEKIYHSDIKTVENYAE